MARQKRQGNRAVLYIRVSTVQQAEEGISLEAQQERLRAYCTLRGLEPVAILIEPGKSAFKPLQGRPEGKKLLDLIRTKQVDAVVALKLDRLFRNTVDCLQTTEAWDKRGVALHLVDLGGSAIDTSSATGKVFLTMLAGFAEFERNLTSERTQLAISHKIAKGELRLGQDAPYGYRHAGKGLADVPAEQAVIATVQELRAGGMSLREIASELSRRGLRNRAGKHFAHVSVDNMLRGPKRLQGAA